MAIDLEKARTALNEKRAELIALSELAAGERNPVTLDQQSVGRLSRMDAMQVQAMAKASEGRRATDLMRIDAAFRRIDDDEYGYCVECGEEIPPKRLEIDPAATHCVQCAQRAEGG